MPFELPPLVLDTLTRLAESGDRTAPTVFAGREEEFQLLGRAVRAVQRGEVGRTVVVQGVPGAGKTALLNEYASRLLSAKIDDERPIIPVPLRPSDFDAPPATLVQMVDKRLRELEANGTWGVVRDRVASGAFLVGNIVFSTVAKRNFDEFKTSAKAPNSLPIALDDYATFRFGRRESTIVLLLDEAQNLNNTASVRAHLDALHGGIHGRTQATLACFGLANTVDHLRELGLSRLASGHMRTIGALSDSDAQHTVTGTLEIALAGCFNEVQRSRWIDAATNVILAESANFPHHLANGCHAVAQLLLEDGIDNTPSVGKIRDRCRERKREYYNARLRPWADHTIAMAHVFGGKDLWTPVRKFKRALMSSDNLGDPVDAHTASNIIREMRDYGYIEDSHGLCRPVLPSLTAYFRDALSQESTPDNEVAQAVRAALSEHDS